MFALLDRAKMFEQQLVVEAFEKCFELYGTEEFPYDQFVRIKEKNLGIMSFLVRTVRPLLAHNPNSLFLYMFCETCFSGTQLYKALENVVSIFPQPKSVLELFTTLREEVLKEYRDLAGDTLSYYLRHPRFSWSALTSMYSGRLVCGPFFPYDPKGFAWNTSGFLFSEDGKIDWTVGPTPTVGQQIAPEALFFIRALKKRWIYINVQCCRSLSEKKRSQALLKTSRSFPDLFRVACISVDSPYYKNPEQWSLDLHYHWIKEQLNSAIESPECGDNWYQFSLFEGEKGAWKYIVDSVLANSYELARGVEGEEAVFHELVVLGLSRSWQLFCSQGECAMTTIACKECIDRGATINAAMMWALKGADLDEKSQAHMVQSILWGRPLLSRYRLVEARRTKGFEALARSFLASDIHRFLGGL